MLPGKRTFLVRNVNSGYWKTASQEVCLLKSSSGSCRYGGISAIAALRSHMSGTGRNNIAEEFHTIRQQNVVESLPTSNFAHQKRCCPAIPSYIINISCSCCISRHILVCF